MRLCGEQKKAGAHALTCRPRWRRIVRGGDSGEGRPTSAMLRRRTGAEGEGRLEEEGAERGRDRKTGCNEKTTVAVQRKTGGGWRRGRRGRMRGARRKKEGGENEVSGADEGVPRKMARQEGGGGEEYHANAGKEEGGSGKARRPMPSPGRKRSRRTARKTAGKREEHRKEKRGSLA